VEETTQFPSHIETGDIVYEDRNQKIRRVVAHFNGFDKEFLVCDFGQRAGIVAVSKQNILLVRQYRLLINDLSYEIPGGFVEEGESPSESASRECLEETGVDCRDVKPLINFHPGLDTNQNYTLIFYSEVTITENTESSSDRHLWVPLSECLEMIYSGKIVDSLSIIGILEYARRSSI
jgi:ADP-ribose pyrophosphatase